MIPCYINLNVIRIALVNFFKYNHSDKPLHLKEHCLLVPYIFLDPTFQFHPDLMTMNSPIKNIKL